MILLEIPLADENSQWAPLGGVWATSLDGTFSWLDSDYTTGWTDTGKENVASVRAGSTYLTLYQARADLDSANEGFFFDSDTDILYIKTPLNRSPYLYIMYIGFPIFIGSELYVDEENGVEYQPRLLSTPKIKRRKDPIEFGNLRFDSQKFTLANADGFFDALVNEDIYGQPVSLYTGDSVDSKDEFTKIYTGKLNGWSISADEVELSTIDERRRLERELPVNTWADLGFSFDGANGYARLVYGEVYNLPLTHTGVGLFAIADTTEHPLKTQAEADLTVTAENSAGGRVAIPSGSLTLFEADGTLGIAEYAEDGSSTYTGDVFYSGFGYDLSNPLDIVKDLIVTYSDIAYTATTFDTTEWESEQSQAPAVSVVIDDKKAVTKIIQEIMSSYLGGFLIDPQGRFTSRRFATGADTQALIDRFQWYDRIKLQGQTDKIYTSVDVGYKQNLNTDKFSHVIDKTEEAAAYLKYNLYRDKSVKTLLTEQADAEAVASRFITQYSDINILATGTIRLTDDILRLQQGQNVLADLSDYRDQGYITSKGLQRCEVIEVNVNPLDLEADLKLRLFQGIEEDDGDLCPVPVDTRIEEVITENGELCVLGEYLGGEILAEAISEGVGTYYAIGAGFIPELTNGTIPNTIY